MNLTPALFKVRFPEFSAVLDAVVQLHLDEADQMLDEARWGGMYDIGCGYYVANNLQLSAIATVAAAAPAPKTVAGSRVNKVKVGEVEYGLSTTDSSGFGSSSGSVEATFYGQKYRNLARLAGIGAVVL